MSLFLKNHTLLSRRISRLSPTFFHYRFRRREGRIGGRRPKLSAQQQAEIRRMVSRGDKTAADAARLFRIHQASVCRLLARQPAPPSRRPSMPNNVDGTTPFNVQSDKHDSNERGEPAENGGSPIALYLAKPEVIFRKIWATPLDDQLHSLLE